MAMLGTYYKQPADEWDYDIDYSEWLPPSDGLSEHVAPTVTLVSDDEELMIESVTRDYDNRRVKVWVSGGTNGVAYKLEITTRSSEGRVRQDEFIIVVRDT